MQQRVMEVIGKYPIKMRCGLVGLDVPLGTSLHVMNAEISLKAGVAMVHAFPDDYHFRTRLINRALIYESHNAESVRLRRMHVIRFDLLKRE